MKKGLIGHRWIVLSLLMAFVVIGCAKEKPIPPVNEEAQRLEEERLRKEEEERARLEKEKAEKLRKEAEAKEAKARKDFEAQMSVMIHFDFDKSDLKPEALDILSQKADLLRQRPTVKIRIEGNCDERGTEEYNLALGERRATAAKKYLVDAGIDEGHISTISYGKERPLDPAHTPEAWEKNRRAEFKIVSW